MNRQQVLIFDFHGTICFDWFWKFMPPSQEKKVSKLIFGMDEEERHLLEAWVLGVLSSEDINYILSKLSGIPYPYLWGHFVRSACAMNLCRESVLLIHELKKDFRVVMATDNMDSFSRFTVLFQNLNELFDGIFNSATMHVLKINPSGIFFKKVFDILAVEPGNCTLFDDNPVVGDIFQGLGGGFRLVSKANPLNVELLKVKFERGEVEVVQKSNPTFSPPASKCYWKDERSDFRFPGGEQDDT